MLYLLFLRLLLLLLLRLLRFLLLLLLRLLLLLLLLQHGYNVLALGQHLDDLAESFVMSAFNNGKLNTMKVNTA